MPDIINVFFLFISAILVVIAYKRTMVSPLTTIVIVSLVSGVVLLSSKNKLLKQSIDRQQNASASALHDKRFELESCQKDLEKKKAAATELESQRKTLSAAHIHLTEEVKKLKEEVANNEELKNTIEELRSGSESQKHENEKLQSEVDQVKQKASDLENDKKALSKQVEDLQKKLQETQAKLTVAEDSAKAAILQAKEASDLAAKASANQAAKPAAAAILVKEAPAAPA